MDLAIEYPRPTATLATAIGTGAYIGYQKIKNQGTDALTLENNGEVPTEEEMREEYGYLEDGQTELDDEILEE